MSVSLSLSLSLYHGSWTESNGFRWRVSLSVAKPGGCGRGVAGRGGNWRRFWP